MSPSAPSTEPAGAAGGDAPAGLVADTVPFSWVDGPGNRFVVFLQGCNLDCLACHNPQTIPRATPRARRARVDELVAEIGEVAGYLSGVTVSGGEATLQAEFVAELFAAVRAGLPGLTTFVDSNGCATPATWRRLLPVMDAAMVDMKALDARVHRDLTGHGNVAVLDSLRLLAGEGKLYEVRLLLVPGWNDAPGQLRRTADWLLGLDPHVRVKVIGFRAHGVRAAARSIPEADEARRAEYLAVLRSAGVEEPVLV